jgi:hypothetical protein
MLELRFISRDGAGYQLSELSDADFWMGLQEYRRNTGNWSILPGLYRNRFPRSCRPESFHHFQEFSRIDVEPAAS